MTKPRILVLTAAGKTGLPIASQLLVEGFPVTAFVRREDARSERLRAKGAVIIVGSQTDVHALRQAMVGVRRAYFNTPLEEGALRSATAFATVAAEVKLESLVVMSQWLASPTHPSVHTRETWLADRLFALLADTKVTTLNPGFFADNNFASLAFAAQFGLLMLPYGEGKNAPPSMTSVCPVMNCVSSDPRYTANAAISSGVPSRPMACRAMNPVRAASSDPAAAALAAMRSSRLGVCTVPGQMALQRMPCFTKSAATDLVRPSTAALLAP